MPGTARKGACADFSGADRSARRGQHRRVRSGSAAFRARSGRREGPRPGQASRQRAAAPRTPLPAPVRPPHRRRRGLLPPGVGHRAADGRRGGGLRAARARWSSTRQASKQSLAVATTFARSPDVLAGLESKDPTAALQPRAEAVRKATKVSYVVVWTPDGTRVTAPQPDLIGKNASRAPCRTSSTTRGRGRSTTKTLQAAPGPTVNSAVPVTRPDGTLAGLVSTGVTVSRVNEGVKRQLPVLLMSAAGGRCCSPRAPPRWSTGGCGARPTAWVRRR